MSSSTRYARIAITLPVADLAAADRLAQQQDRSRSWIVAEAVRRYAASVDQSLAHEDLGSSRRAQLQRDLALTAEARVRAAEDTLLLEVQVTEPHTFATFDEFLAWRREGGVSAR